MSYQQQFGSQRRWAIQEMKDKHWDILELLLEGYKKKDIAAMVGMSAGMVGAITLSPLFIQ